MALTDEERKNLKSGDTVLVEAKVGIVTATGADVSHGCISLLLPFNKLYPAPEQPKYDPYRWFKKGDKVHPRKVNGRCPFGVEITDSKPRHMDFGATVQEDEDQYGMVRVNTLRGDIKIHSHFLELVTPVEELEPYELVESTDYWSVEKEDEELCLFWKKHHPHAEAECDRLNEAWRKEQNHG